MEFEVKLPMKFNIDDNNIQPFLEQFIQEIDKYKTGNAYSEDVVHAFSKMFDEYFEEVVE